MIIVSTIIIIKSLKATTTTIVVTMTMLGDVFGFQCDDVHWYHGVGRTWGPSNDPDCRSQRGSGESTSQPCCVDPLKRSADDIYTVIQRRE